MEISQPSSLLTLTNIVLPFTHQLTSNLTEGDLITVRGVMHIRCERFQIDFLNEENDVYIHINPRFDENVIVRNSKLNGSWGQEERTKSIRPLCSSPTFEMMILFNKESCSISSNGVHLFKYFYRMPINEIKKISISGEVDINSIVLSRNNLEFHSNFIKPIELRNPKVPFIHTLKVESGLTVTVFGRPRQRSDFFTINFENEKQIFMHISVRFGERAIVRNSRDLNLKWNEEERSLVYFPFSQGLSFDMYITVTEKEYLCSINKRLFFRFQHRVLPLGLINQFSIKGDIDLHSVRFDYN